MRDTVYHVHAQVADHDRDLYRELRFHTAQHPSETRDRLVARMLAFCICYRDGLAFTRGVCAGDEPDAWLRDGDGRVRLWIEVGKPAARRLRRAARRSGRVLVFAFGRPGDAWERLQGAKCAELANVTVVRLAPAFLARLAGVLERNNVWSLSVSGAMLYVHAGDSTLAASVAPWHGPPL